ncbi:MAG: putative signal transduction histidine kinase [Phycisphaerales bacterium]|nr:putative signal transduction histidine kinase [Phycisphaerales bacterium]
MIDVHMSILTADPPAELSSTLEVRRRRKAMRVIARRYAVSILAVGISLLFKLYLKTHMELGMEQEAPFMLSLAAVMVSGWYGGLGPGLLATGFALVIGDYFFMEPFHSLGLVTTAQKIRAAMFTIEGVVVSVLCQTLNSARRRAERNEAEARNLQKELLEITDTEQRRIGHDLHDGLGQHLTGIAFMSKLMEQRLAAKTIPEAEDARKIAGLVNKAIGWTRDLARGLAPVDLDQEEGLASALKQLTEGTSELYGAPCRFESLGNSHFRNPPVAIHLYRIAQEALNNAIKHARPRSIVVQLTRTQGEIRISVEDDGKGFDPISVRTGGMGLRIMRYRAKMISGQLEVRKRLGGGTVVACTCALHHSQKDASYAHRDQAIGSEDNQGQGTAR